MHKRVCYAVDLFLICDIIMLKKGQGDIILEKKKLSKKAKTIIITLTSIFLVLCIAAGGIFAYVHHLLGNMERGEIKEEELSINEEAFKGVDVVNIALFGIDARSDTNKGLSDAIIVFTLDKKHKKIKMTSIARDSYVKIERESGVIKDKITHAYGFYKDSGPQLSIKALNQNFDLNITDYITVNFFGFSQIIDALGGVMVDVDEHEMMIMNREYVTHLNEIGIKCDPITETGLQLLTGPQALAYSRNRYTGNDVDRGNRQKEVIAAVYDKMKTTSVNKLPELASMGLSHCETSLTNAEIIELAFWVLKNPCTMENISLPDDECNPKGGLDAFVNGVWYYIYDIDIAKQKLHDFINEEGKYYKATEAPVTENSSVAQ